MESILKACRPRSLRWNVLASMVAESNMMIGTIVAKMRSFIEFMVLIMGYNYFDRAGHEFIRLNLFF
ncbi:MAG TPA: hypothetical protein DCE22_00420 [Verrucomicrobiales bacterium]|nr:hypothetical protein [Verrucomicrobiales bacterium]